MTSERAHTTMPEPMLGFQFMPACVQETEGLPPIGGVVPDEINQNKPPTRAMDSRRPDFTPAAFFDFTPAFVDFGRPMQGGGGFALTNMAARRPPPRKIILDVSINDDVQLKKSENGWKPGLQRETATDDES